MKATGSLSVRLGEKQQAAWLVTLTRLDALLSDFQSCREVCAPQLGTGFGLQGVELLWFSLWFDVRPLPERILENNFVNHYNRYLALTKVLVINRFYREGTTNYILSKTQQETSIRQVSSIYCKHWPKPEIYEQNASHSFTSFFCLSNNTKKQTYFTNITQNITILSVLCDEDDDDMILMLNVHSPQV